MRVSAFAPGSVSNIACGFDCLGFAVDGPGDLVTAERKDTPGVEILEIVGDGGRLPLEADRNTAGVAVAALLEDAGAQEEGISLRLEKRMPLSSGLGSSAASAVAGARAVAELLGLGVDRHRLLRAALEGERIACGSAHPDNATPSLYGGFVLIRSMDPLDVVELPVPEGLTCALVRPHVSVETRAARGALGESVPLSAAVRQWANLGSLVAGLYRGDLELVSRSLVDHVAEPKRAHLVPGFRDIQAAAVEAGALGCSLSGSGPSIFALCADAADAERVADAMRNAVDGPADRLVSPVGAGGVRVTAEHP
ncbi:MAG: homoserine kinase [Acidobacteriota bacterium]